MLLHKLLVLAACSAAVIEPAMAEGQPAGVQYSLVARLLSNGQYQAEIWRRDDNGQDGFVGTNYKSHASAAKAIDDACLLLRKYFDPSFSCPQTQADQKTTERTSEPGVSVPEPQPLTAKKKAGDRPVAATPTTGSAPAGKSTAAGKIAIDPKAMQAKRGVVSDTKTSTPRPSQWAKEFWENQARWSHGGGDGGGGGGGGGSD